jgi:hypothetical protein
VAGRAGGGLRHPGPPRGHRRWPHGADLPGRGRAGARRPRDPAGRRSRAPRRARRRRPRDGAPPVRDGTLRGGVRCALPGAARPPARRLRLGAGLVVAERVHALADRDHPPPLGMPGDAAAAS